jgi:uncharacterized protein
MRVLITGCSGFVGTHLSRTLLEQGHQVTGLVRSARSGALLPDAVVRVTGDPTRPGEWQRAVSGHDVIVNMAGASIFDRRWTPAYKELLRDSRIRTTRNLVDAIPAAEGSHMTLLSTSAVGYYGFTGDEELDENSPAGNDFLARLARDWEAEACRAAEKGVRVARIRFGVVLGRRGGALEQMVRPFRYFVGGPLGDGRQWFSWMHLEDLCRATLFVMAHDDISGPVNFTAPGPVRNRDLARTICRVLRRPSFMPAPAFMIELALGEFGSVILKGQRVVPRALLSKGFSFTFPDIESALRHCLLG